MAKLVFIILIILSACAIKSDVIVMNYDEFGPQAMSFETIGYGWYEWNSHGSQSMDNIKVVVYQNNKSSVLNQYQDSQSSPAIDYRFIYHQSALDYLNRNIRELSTTNQFPDIISQLKLTKQKIESM